MSTSIEFMREHLAWVGANLPLDADTSEDPLYAALASVLRDAERFKALERAQWLRVQVGRDDRSFVSRRPGSSNEFSCESLGELADYLRRLGCDKRPAGK